MVYNITLTLMKNDIHNHTTNDNFWRTLFHSYSHYIIYPVFIFSLYNLPSLLLGKSYYFHPSATVLEAETIGLLEADNGLTSELKLSK